MADLAKRFDALTPQQQHRAVQNLLLLITEDDTPRDRAAFATAWGVAMDCPLCGKAPALHAGSKTTAHVCGKERPNYDRFSGVTSLAHWNDRVAEYLHVSGTEVSPPLEREKEQPATADKHDVGELLECIDDLCLIVEGDGASAKKFAVSEARALVAKYRSGEAKGDAGREKGGASR